MHKLSTGDQMINVYVQIRERAEKCATFRKWTEREQTHCQNLANRFRYEVRALNYNDRKVLGTFQPRGRQGRG